VIEAAAAGIPMVAAKVAASPKFFRPHTEALFAPNSGGRHGGRDRNRAGGPRRRAGARKIPSRANLSAFSQKAMVEGVLAGFATRLQIVNVLYQR